MYAKINDLGFIETPTVRWPRFGRVNLNNDEVAHLTAEIEEGKTIAQGNAPLNDDGTFIRSTVKARRDADFPVVAPLEVELMDVSPAQIASIAASLIPFLEHDDANRALMGSNTMRQAVPLMRSEALSLAQASRHSSPATAAHRSPPKAKASLSLSTHTIRIRYDRTEDEEFVAFDSPVKEYKIPKFRKNQPEHDHRPPPDLQQGVSAL